MPASAATVLLPLGLLLVAALGAFGWLHALAMPLPRLLLPAAAFVCYGAAGLHATRAGTSHGTAVALIWTIAVLARLALLPLPPELSDDIYRYLWDGHVLGQGTNPYACLLYTSPSPRDGLLSRMPSSA